jgi:hypothetical protein
MGLPRSVLGSTQCVPQVGDGSRRSYTLARQHDVLGFELEHQFARRPSCNTEFGLGVLVAS